MEYVEFKQCCNSVFRSLSITNTILIRVLHGHKTVRDEKHIKSTAEPNNFIYLRSGETLLVKNNIGIKGLYNSEGITIPDDFIKDYTKLNKKNCTYSNSRRSGLMTKDFNEAFSHLSKSISQPNLPLRFLKHRAYELLMWLEDMGVSHQIPQKNSLSNRLQTLLKSCPDQRWKAANAAKKLGMSEATLRRKLALESTSFSEQLREIRLSIALMKIQTTSEPLSKIALESGFSSQPRLSEAFKLRFNLSPAKLRMSECDVFSPKALEDIT